MSMMHESSGWGREPGIMPCVRVRKISWLDEDAVVSPTSVSGWPVLAHLRTVTATVAVGGKFHPSTSSSKIGCIVRGSSVR